MNCAWSLLGVCARVDIVPCVAHDSITAGATLPGGMCDGSRTSRRDRYYILLRRLDLIEPSKPRSTCRQSFPIFLVPSASWT